MKKLFTLFIFLLCLKSTRAQYITIPDTSFVTWLNHNTFSIMIGNQMDTTSVEFANILRMDISGLSIYDLTGIKYFTYLKYLNCSYNHLTNCVSTWPNSLDSLDCKQSLMDSLDNLPNSLVYLQCWGNSINNLPNIPNSLKELYCGNNGLFSLPVLPNTLKKLEFTSTNITSIPVFPDSLIDLNCSNNPLSLLPSLPSKLNTLGCSYNNLTSLPTLPDSLTVLSCAHNSLVSLPALPSKLYYLDCQFNQITSLPSLPSGLKTLHCEKNQLNSLPNLPNTLYTLYSSDNNITCYPILPNSLAFLGIYSNPFTCIPNYTSNMAGSYLLAYPLCNATNIYGCQQSVGIAGNIYLDTNLNCVKNILERKIVNIPMKLYNSGLLIKQSTTSLDSTYNFSVSTGTYNVVLDTVNKPYKTICTYPGNDSLVIVGSSSTLTTDVDFPVICKPGFDIGIQSIIENGVVFPGQQHILKINAGDISNWYNLHCASGVGGTLSFSISGPITYIGPAVGSLTPSVAGSIYTYSISDFGTIYNSGDFSLKFNTNATAVTGDVICVSATVTPISGDNNPSNNIYNYCYLVTNSHDPNIKEVYPIDVQPGFNDWLTYSIHFQNTGNASAYNISLADTLDNMLDLETFEVINYSHENIFDLTGNILNIRFPNIMLPDSTSNPEGSIGFIQYRIKPKTTWVSPHKIKNTAYIYFDFNAPVATNTTYNSILTVTDLKESKESIAALYPNPTNGTFTIELNSKEKKITSIV